MSQPREDEDLHHPGLFVQPGDVAILVRATHWHNYMKVGHVVQRLPGPEGDNRVWWLCEFPRPVKTSLGWMYLSCIPDEDLRRLSLPVPRWRYPSFHYHRLSVLANALSASHEYREASA